MREVASATELAKLRHELGLDPDGADLAFLGVLTPDQVAVLRRGVVTARHGRHEHRFSRIAGLSRLLPPAVTARAAEAALGPLVAARAAAAMDVADAVRLARRISPAFLTELTTHLDPGASRDLVAALPEPLLLEVGRRLLARDEHLVLGRYVGVMPAAASAQVITSAPGAAILAVARYAEDSRALDEVLAALPDETLLRVLGAAGEGDRAEDAVELVGRVGLEARVRIFDLVPELERHQQRRLVGAVVRLGAWEHVLPVLSRIRPRALHQLLVLPEIADPTLVSALMHDDG